MEEKAVKGKKQMQKEKKREEWQREKGLVAMSPLTGRLTPPN